MFDGRNRFRGVRNTCIICLWISPFFRVIISYRMHQKCVFIFISFNSNMLSFIIKGHTDIAEVLLSRGCEALKPDNNGVRPLHYAAQNNFGKTLDAMLMHNEVKDMPDNDGRSALMWAAAKGLYFTAKAIGLHFVITLFGCIARPFLEVGLATSLRKLRCLSSFHLLRHFATFLSFLFFLLILFIIVQAYFVVV